VTGTSRKVIFHSCRRKTASIRSWLPRPGLRMSRLPWNFGGGPRVISVARPGGRTRRRRHAAPWRLFLRDERSGTPPRRARRGVVAPTTYHRDKARTGYLAGLGRPYRAGQGLECRLDGACTAGGGRPGAGANEQDSQYSLEQAGQPGRRSGQVVQPEPRVARNACHPWVAWRLVDMQVDGGAERRMRGAGAISGRRQ
jgi:hypothetical protein